jgi:hypothetical protein
MTYYVTVNPYAKHDELPYGFISVTSLSMVPDSQSMIKTKLVKEYPVLPVYSVCNVHHSTRFSWKAMAGWCNTF